MFKGLGLLLSLYVVYAVIAGKVFAKDGARGATVSRVQGPAYFWAVIAIYAGLALALLTVF